MRGFDACFRRQVRGLPGSNCRLLIDFVWCKTILRPSIPNPSIAKFFTTAARDYFANPVPEDNANHKNQDPVRHVWDNTPWLGSSFKCSAVTLIAAGDRRCGVAQQIMIETGESPLDPKRTMVPSGAFGRFAIWGLKLI